MGIKGCITCCYNEFFVFRLLKNMNFDKLPDFIKKILHLISDACFGGYLISFIFDQIYYNKFDSNITGKASWFRSYMMIVPLVFVSSILFSIIINLIYKIIFYKINERDKRII